MTSSIITKNSSTATAVPAVGDLQQGELAVNVTDKKVYTKDSSAAIVKVVGSLGNQEANAVAITGGTVTGITDLAVADGGTGASTAAGALNNLLPSQTSNANKYLQTDGTNATWDAISISTADITGTLPVANGGTGVTSSTGTGNVVLSNSPTLVTPALGTPASGVATNLTGLPISTGVSGLGTGVATFLATPSSANLISAVTDETGTGSLVFATSPTLVTPALGTPSALVGTNITGTASGLTAGNVTTNANLTGAVTSVGNATSLGSFTSSQLAGALTDETGSGANVFATSPTLVTPTLGVATATSLQGIIGNVTPAAGAFTTLSASGIVTLQSSTNPNSRNLATKNLIYNEGAAGNIGFEFKNLTSGNLQYFTVESGDVMSFSAQAGQRFSFSGVTKLETTSGGVSITGTLGVSGVSTFAAGTAALPALTTTGDTNTGIFFPAADTVATSVGGSEGMRLTSTGLGIGTSSPSTRLHVKSADNTTASVIVENLNNTNAILQFGSASTDYQILGGAYQGELRLNVPTGSLFNFSINGASKVSVNSSGNLKTIGTVSVGNATPSTSGAGITFPATQSASSNANTLDDYEEGTFSVYLTDGTNNTATASATYTKTGRVVTIQLQIYNATYTGLTAGSTIRISGLPFAPSGACNAPISFPNSSYPTLMTQNPGGTDLFLYTTNGASNTDWQAVTRTLLGGSTISMYASLTYFV